MARTGGHPGGGRGAGGRLAWLVLAVLAAAGCAPGAPTTKAIDDARVEAADDAPPDPGLDPRAPDGHGSDDVATPDADAPDATPDAVPDAGADAGPDVPPVNAQPVQGQGGRCVTVRAGTLWLGSPAADAFAFTADADAAARFTLHPSDLATYLFYDTGGGYLLADEGPLRRATALQSDVTRVEDGYVSGAEWHLWADAAEPDVRYLQSRRTERWLGPDGLAASPLALTLEPADGCTPHPELSLDAEGTVTRTTFDDGALYGFVDAHSHLLSNVGFGGGIYHGGAFHRLGVAHALPDCSVVHGPEGRHDFFGHVFDTGGVDGAGVMGLITSFLTGQLSEPNHATAGWPDFPDWPDALRRSTHQTQYHRWLERAWMAGLRLVVQHATTDYVICTLMTAEGVQPRRYDCEDMTSIDRILDETWAMQRYLDAQAGGEGKGWFRVVQSPAEARAVIAAGKLAVVLGIETSNLFRCHLTPRPDGPVCDEAWVASQLDLYHARGVRAVFPVHKYDNRFSPGDGSGGFLQLGNFFNSGHWTNKAEGCPGVPGGWDGGGVTFGGLVQARDQYLSEPQNDLSGFATEPVKTALPFADEIQQPALPGDWCQNATLTPVGEALLAALMARGMIVELDHLPQRSYARAFEILDANDYPAAGTHGRHWNGRIYEHGGVSTIGLGRCQDPDDPGSTVRGLTERVALIASKGGYPAEGFGFDLNGFAGAPGPRFAPNACGKPQPNPIAYPFASYAGDVTFTAPRLGNRAVDFNTEGMRHIGLLPELIQDARADAGDAALEPLFRSAEAYVRMWEKAERRAAEMADARGQPPQRSRR